MTKDGLRFTFYDSSLIIPPNLKVNTFRPAIPYTNALCPVMARPTIKVFIS